LETNAGVAAIIQAQETTLLRTSFRPSVQPSKNDIPYCQSKNKKILLSLGGASATYALTGVAEGIALADFLWGAYGPLTPEWVTVGGIRPLDRSSSNTSTLAEYQIDIDGFDLISNIHLLVSFF
jgi:hypothetical protein